MNEPQQEEDHVHRLVEPTPASQPTLAPTATTAMPAATGELTTHDLLQMMLSMQQSMNTFQLSMAEQRAAEKKAQEAREMRELAMREKMLELEQKKLEDMQATREQAIKDAAAQQKYREDQEAAQTQAKADQERLLKEQEEAKEKRQKEYEEARKKEERLKAIPNTPAMTKVTDLVEYLALFETTQTRKEREEEEWSIHLLPLLNDKFRVVAMNMSPDERDNYQILKTKLIESDETNLKNSAHSFWTLSKEKSVDNLPQFSRPYLLSRAHHPQIESFDPRHSSHVV